MMTSRIVVVSCEITLQWTFQFADRYTIHSSGRDVVCVVPRALVTFCEVDLMPLSCLSYNAVRTLVQVYAVRLKHRPVCNLNMTGIL